MTDLSAEIAAVGPTEPDRHDHDTGGRVDDETGSRLMRAEARRRRRSRLFVHGARLLVLVVIFGLWEYSARSEWINPLFFSMPSEIWTFAIDYRADLWSDAQATLYAASVAFLIGTSTGILAGVALAKLTFLNRVLEPIFMVLASMPRVALAPLFILIFGITPSAKIALGVSLVFFIILFNTRAAVQNTDPDLVVLSRTLCMTRARALFRITLPWAFPSILASMRLCIIYSLLAVVASEMLGARDGLGLAIVRASQTLQTAGVFAPIFILSLLATGLNVIIQVVERRVLAWQDTAH